MLSPQLNRRFNIVLLRPRQPLFAFLHGFAFAAAGPLDGRRYRHGGVGVTREIACLASALLAGRFVSPCHDGPAGRWAPTRRLTLADCAMHAAYEIAISRP
jgi:hypothetical protein